jgi:hypothetical protein
LIPIFIFNHGYHPPWTYRLARSCARSLSSVARTLFLSPERRTTPLLSRTSPGHTSVEPSRLQLVFEFRFISWVNKRRSSSSSGGRSEGAAALGGTPPLPPVVALPRMPEEGPRRSTRAAARAFAGCRWRGPTRAALTVSGDVAQDQGHPSHEQMKLPEGGGTGRAAALT